MTYLTNSDQSIKLVLPSKQQQKFTIGRIPQNSLQILDSTVSKNHAIIYYFAHQKRYVLQDLGSINGTYVNGSLVSNNKIYLKHNDQIQFGKNDQKYYLKFPNPQPEKKGKINLKDYNFQLQQEFNVKPVLQTKKVPQLSNVNVEAKTQTGWNKISKVSQDITDKKSRQKFERAIKIPKFEQFLQIEGSQLQQPTNIQAENKNIEMDEAPKKWQKNIQKVVQKGGVKLPQLNKVQLSQEDKLNKMIIQRKRELQRAQKQALLKKAQQQQRMIQQRLRLQLQKAQQQEQILRKKYEMERKAEQQQKQLLKQKTLLQQKIRLQQKQAKQRQQLRAIQLKQKQQALLNEMKKVKQYQMLKLRQKQQQIIRQLQQQKQRQIQEIKQKEIKKRTQKQEQIKRDIQNRKKQLQLQAQALTRQYQNIYKQTIKKLKLNIQTEQSRVLELETSIQKLNKQIYDLNSCIEVQDQQHNILREQFNQINGRNKAFLLYASHLQSKIDTLKLQLQKASIKDPSKTSLQIKQSLIHSRKLLNMKINQHRQLQNQIKQSFMKLNISSPNSQSYLSTILQNYQEIQKLKQIYFQFLQQQKIIQNKWDLQLEENNILQEKVRNVRKDIEGNKKKLAQNLNQNLKKLTQQRLHMLKMMYYVPQQKKNAAKYLIQQMINIQQQNKAIVLDSQQVHSKITQLIISIQDSKRQNEQLSNIIFGNDTMSHHFDNMKIQINKLISCIQNQRDEYKVSNMIKMSEQLKQLQNKIYLQTKRQKKLKDQIKNTAYTIPPLNTQKNPLVFFGQLLAKKDIQLSSSQQEQKNLQKKLNQMRSKVGLLTQKKSKINKLLQDYKQKELRNIRDYLK